MLHAAWTEMERLLTGRCKGEREHNTSVARAALGANLLLGPIQDGSKYEAIFVPLHQPVPPGQAGKACCGPRQPNNSDQQDPGRELSLLFLLSCGAFFPQR